MAVIKISPEQIKRKKRKGPKGHAVDLSGLEAIKTLLGNASRQKDFLIEHLHKIQDNYHHISSKHLVALAHEMNLSPAEVYEVASFYHHFDVVKEGQTPPPDLTVRVCESVACELNGASKLLTALEKGLKTDTVRIQKVPCIGRCQHAPVAVVGQNPIDNATSENIQSAIKNKEITAPVTNYISFEDYKIAGGYQTARKVIEGKMSAESVMKIMENSGLRGLGGAGFPAGRKWRIVNGF
ncbi:MAG: NAD(P)H-dependent oxidoreductase subunit E, partial [Methylococcales bacterium]|nr:NAD(P)H-dependent oxidoreductase subunit E [Methylococcales bacterium]